jgi:hypothetical protein
MSLPSKIGVYNIEQQNNNIKNKYNAKVGLQE